MYKTGDLEFLLSQTPIEQLRLISNTSRGSFIHLYLPFTGPGNRCSNIDAHSFIHGTWFQVIHIRTLTWRVLNYFRSAEQNSGKLQQTLKKLNDVHVDRLTLISLECGYTVADNAICIKIKCECKVFKSTVFPISFNAIW